jgi:hypothetical protein
MAIYKTYSKHLRKGERAGQPDIYQYDELPQPLRVQIVHIWRSTIGSTLVEGHFAPASESIYAVIKQTLCKELGTFSLTGSDRVADEGQCKCLLLDGSTL